MWIQLRVSDKFISQFIYKYKSTEMAKQRENCISWCKNDQHWWNKWACTKHDMCTYWILKSNEQLMGTQNSYSVDPKYADLTDNKKCS